MYSTIYSSCNRKIKCLSTHFISNFFFDIVRCPPVNLSNGTVYYNSTVSTDGGYTWYTVANFTCNDGYNLTGPSSSTCEWVRTPSKTSSWIPSPPICESGN